MRFEIEQIGNCVLAPAIVAAALSVLSRRFLEPELHYRAGNAWAMVGGFITAYLLLPWAPKIPTESWHWIPYLAIATALIGPAAVAKGVSMGERVAIVILLATIGGLLLIPTWPDLQPARYRYAVGLACSFTVVWLLLAPLVGRVPSASFAFLFAAILIGGAAVLVLSGNLKIAQLAVAAAFSLCGCAGVAYFRTEEGIFRGALPLITVLLIGLMFTGYIESYSSVPVASYVTVVVAPLGLWLAELGIRGESVRRWQLAVRTASVLVPVAAAIALAGWATL